MAPQDTSAERLVALATSSQETINRVKADPEGTLHELSEQAMAMLPPPSPTTNNFIWMIVVISFSLVMVGSATVLCVGVFVEIGDVNKHAAKSDTILTLFTTVVAFLAGLLTPSPVK